MSKLTEAREVAALDLARCARELLQWRRSGILPEGALLYRVAEAWSGDDGDHDSLQQAEYVVTLMALEAAAATGGLARAVMREPAEGGTSKPPERSTDVGLEV